MTVGCVLRTYSKNEGVVMEALTGILFMLAVAVFVLGMIIPKKLNLTRKKAALISLGLVVGCIVVAPSKTPIKATQKEANTTVAKTEEVKNMPSQTEGKDESGEIDYSWPIEHYSIVTTLPDSNGFKWKSYLLLANSNATDNIKFNEFASDAARKAMQHANGNFEEKEIFDRYFPQIKATLDVYAKKKYLAVPFQTGADLSGGNDFTLELSILGYDFKRKGFEVDWHSSGFLDDLEPSVSKEKHFFQVEDEALAKKIESLRANDSLMIQGFVFFHLDGFRNDGVGDDRFHLKGKITHVMFLLKDMSAPSKSKELLSFYIILDKNGDVEVKYDE